MKTTVALCKLDSYDPAEVDSALGNMLDLLGGLSQFVTPGQYVLIKPNVIVARREAQTNPVVVIELAKRVREFGCRVAIGDSPGWGTLVGNARKSGLLQLAEQNDIPLFGLKRAVKVHSPDGMSGQYHTVSHQALDADAVINVPKLKSHQQLVLSGAVKNMFGIVPGKRKAWRHLGSGADSRRFARMIIETYLLVKPVLTIVDGVEAMEGPGPARGHVRKLSALIGSSDGFAADLVVSRLIGCDPGCQPIMRAAWELGLARRSLDELRLVGVDVGDLAVDDFEFPPLVPIRFSLPRVIKSTLKQAYLLTVGRMGKR